MNIIMYTTLHYNNEKVEKINYFTKPTAIFFLLVWTFPTRYTESEIIEAMNYLLYVFISSVCMHECEARKP